ncbi:MAG: DUF222 domain-containing protein [Actinomycetes bacterium]
MGHEGSGTDQEEPWVVPGVRSAVFPPAAHVVAEVRAAVAQFTQDAERLPTEPQLVAMRQLIDRLEGLWLAASADFSESGEIAKTGHRTLASWMRHRCRISPAEAFARSKAAFAATGPQPASGEALRVGQISWRHAQVIDQTLQQVPAERRDEAEQALVTQAKKLDPGQLRRVGERLVHCFDRDRADEQAVRRLERRGLSVAETYDGMVSVSGLLDPTTGATLLTALNAQMRPATQGNDAPRDIRTPAQRRADALGEICSEWLSSVNTATVGGVRPHLSVIVDQATLASRRGDGASVEPAQLGWFGPVTASEAQLIGCDAAVSRIVMSGESQVIDVGRATRTIPPALRRAVVARDRVCIAPGCSRLPEHCDVHHVIFWEHGGETSLENTVLICRHHHRMVHLRDWRVVVDTTGRRTLQPPI